MSLLFLVLLANIASGLRLVPSKQDRYIIACHTTDFQCFKRQYVALRDHVLVGNKHLNIPTYKPFAFKYGDTGTCVMLTGFEDSELASIGFDNTNKEYSIVLKLPLKVHQVKNHVVDCIDPDRAFTKPIPRQNGPLMRFTGNATIQVTYPYKLKKKTGEVFLDLQDEDVDLVVDIPDLSHLDTASETESRLFQWSEWAYEVVQHVDAAQKFAVPYTSTIRTLMDGLPLRKFILLYPDEDFTSLQFIYTDTLQS